jgi:UDP-N-acetylmuramyl pentapeptide synthase
VIRSVPGARRRQHVQAFNRWLRPGLSWCLGGYRRTLIRSTRVVAVVGSFGKTTATRAISVALGMPAHHRGRNTWRSIAKGLLGTVPGQRRTVMEVGIDGPGQMASRAWMLAPDIAVVMSIGGDHRASFKTLEVTRHEKGHIVRALRPGGTAVLNGDDRNVLWMATQTAARVVTFGFGASNDIRASDMTIGGVEGTRFTLHTASDAVVVRTRLLGTPAVYALLAAVAVGVSEGLPLRDILGRLADLVPVEGRLEPIVLPTGAVLLRDDVKAGEETIDAALDVLEAMPARRRMVVFAGVDEPGPSQRTRSRRIGRRIGAIAVRAIVIDYGGSTRSLTSGLSDSGLSSDAIHIVPAVSQAMEWLSDLRQGDLVLLKGRRGHRMTPLVLALRAHGTQSAGHEPAVEHLQAPDHPRSSIRQV